MGFPPGMQLATIAFGIPLTATGKDVVTTVSVKPTARVIWAATGQPLPEFSDSFTAEAGQLGSFQVPFADQAGFIDSTGATVTDFAYQVTASWSFGKERPITWSKNLKPLVGQTGTIDLDLVPDGPVSIPVTAPTAAVLGFGGRTGFITLQESDLPARLSVGELSATYGPTAVPMLEVFDRAERGVFGGRAVFLGTSIMHGDDNLSYVGKNGNSPPTHAALASDGRWKHIANAGVDGDTSTAMLARFASDVLSLNPSTIVIDPIPNDASSGFTNAQTEANVTAMVKLASKAGAKVILVNGCPNSTQLANISRLNSWIARYAARYGIPLVDWHSELVDPATGGIRAGEHTGDNVHPTHQARQLLGIALDKKLREVIPPSSLFMFNYAADPANLLGAAGFFSGAVNGGAPAGLTDGWEAGSSFTNVTVSAQTVAGIQGKTIRATGAASTPGHSIYKDILTGFSAGDVLEFSGIFNQLDTRGTLGASAQLNPLGAGDATLSSSAPFSVVANLPKKIDYGRWNKEVTVPAGTLKLRLYLTFATDPGFDGNYSTEFAQVGVRNLTTGGVANV